MPVTGIFKHKIIEHKLSKHNASTKFARSYLKGLKRTCAPNKITIHSPSTALVIAFVSIAVNIAMIKRRANSTNSQYHARDVYLLINDLYALDASPRCSELCWRTEYHRMNITMQMKEIQMNAANQMNR
eukprot:1006474_1